MEIVDFCILQTFIFIDKVMFAPLVLIGLLITSLSLILNLKDDNEYIRDFRKGKNSKRFIDIIYQTIVSLLFIFFLTLLKIYLPIPQVFNIYYHLFYGFYTLSYMLILLHVLINMFSISFILKEIVFTSLRDK